MLPWLPSTHPCLVNNIPKTMSSPKVYRSAVCIIQEGYAWHKFKSKHLVLFLLQILSGGSYWTLRILFPWIWFRGLAWRLSQYKEEIWALPCWSKWRSRLEDCCTANSLSLSVTHTYTPWIIWILIETNLNKYLLASFYQLPLLASDRVLCPHWAYILTGRNNK